MGKTSKNTHKFKFTVEVEAHTKAHALEWLDEVIQQAINYKMHLKLIHLTLSKENSLKDEYIQRIEQEIKRIEQLQKSIRSV